MQHPSVCVCVCVRVYVCARAHSFIYQYFVSEGVNWPMLPNMLLPTFLYQIYSCQPLFSLTTSFTKIYWKLRPRIILISGPTTPPWGFFHLRNYSIVTPRYHPCVAHTGKKRMKEVRNRNRFLCPFKALCGFFFK